MKKFFLIFVLSVISLGVYSQGTPVDLGLSVKWASCNLGATRPEGIGKFYAWGETSPKGSYSSFNCRTYKKEIGDDIAGTQYDAARVNWGGKWRMPTASEIKELVTKCTFVQTQLNGAHGMKFTGPNGNSIFLPYSGYKSDSEIYNVYSYGYYWSSTSRNIYSARSFTIGHTNDSRDERCDGLTIRPVCP